jgi:hypothetical protein
VRTQSDSLPPSYELLAELVQELNTRPGIRARFLPLPDGPGLIKAKRTAPAGRRQWAYIDNMRTCLRTFTVIEAMIHKDYFYLIEVERRPEASSDRYCAQVFSPENSISISNIQIYAIRDTLSKQEGRIKDLASLSAAGVKLLPKQLRHTFSSANEYANKFLSMISCCTDNL